MARQFVNNYETTLTAGIDNIVTTIPVASVAGLPSISADNPVSITIENVARTVREIVLCTQVSGSDLIVTRGDEGTTPQSFVLGDRVEARLTAGVLAQFVQINGDYQIEGDTGSPLKLYASSTRYAFMGLRGNVNAMQYIGFDGLLGRFGHATANDGTGFAEFWDESNDGDGSGLDADLLDGTVHALMIPYGTTNAGSSSTTNLGSVTRAGFYSVSAGATSAPTANAGTLIHTANGVSANRDSQIFIDGSTNTVWIRSENGTSWSAWESLGVADLTNYMRKDIDETVNGNVTFTALVTADVSVENESSVTSSASTTTLDAGAFNNFETTLSENTTIAFSNMHAAGKVWTGVFAAAQPTGQAYTLDFPAACVDSAGAAIPQAVITADKRGVWTFWTNDGGTQIVTQQIATDI